MVDDEEEDAATADELLDDFDSLQQSFGHLMFVSNNTVSKRVKDRKSSGYDSLGGESSSLDSNGSHKQPAAAAGRVAVAAPAKQNHSWMQLSPNNLENPPKGISDISPCSNNGNSIKLLQYDEADIMRMDKRLKGSSLNSSPYSSLS